MWVVTVSIATYCYVMKLNATKIKRRIRLIVLTDWRWIRRYVLGYKIGSDPDSNIRRYFTRLIFILSIWLILQNIFSDKFFEENQFFYQLFSFYLLAIAFLFFMTNIVNIVFSASESFKINTQRLFLDVVVSSLFHIVAFSCVFRTFRILDGDGRLVQTLNFTDHLYFSIVTFSTLGYGDFTPSGNSRLFAAYEALIGNVHLGFLVGATFLAANQYRSKKK